MTEPKRFQTKRDPKRFYVDDDEFLAAPTLAAGVMIDMSDVKAKLRGNVGQSAKDQWKEIMEIFQMVLLPQSFALLEQRLHSTEKPIDAETMVGILQWLFSEAYAEFPTEPSSFSPPTSQTEIDGGSSMAGVQLAESIQSLSLGSDSST
jgi:hypothetical protein